MTEEPAGGRWTGVATTVPLRVDFLFTEYNSNVLSDSEPFKIINKTGA